MLHRYGAYREYKRLSQQQLAEMIEVDQSFISRIEQGTKQVSTDTLHKLGTVLGLDYDEILGQDIKTKSKVAQALYKKVSTHEGLKSFVEDTVARKITSVHFPKLPLITLSKI